MIEIEHSTIDRIIIHRVHKKSDQDQHGISEYSEELFDFGTNELNTLKERISSAFSRDKRFFKLEIARSDSDTFFDNATSMKSKNDEVFIQNSKSIADLLAQSHDRRTIPGGLLLIMDGKTEGKYFVLVVKAELQEAFTITEENDHKFIELVSDLFLSPAKDFYKIGILLEDSNNLSPPNDLYSCYMYDDNFSSGKRDLAEYFYSNFLGFTTNSNDKLLTKNFYDDIISFIEENVEGFDNRKGLKNTIKTLYRENTTGIINPSEFADQYLEGELLRIYRTEIGEKYPHSFTKDLLLVDRKMQRGSIKLKRDLKIEGPADSIDTDVDVLDGQAIDIDLLKVAIENGEYEQIVTIKTGNH